jgi:hypothetical protein
MADRFDLTDPRHLTPDQRLDELWALLAKGARRVLALRAEAAITPAMGPGPGSPESARNPLDVSADMRLHVPVRLTQVEAAEGVEA